MTQEIVRETEERCSDRRGAVSNLTRQHTETGWQRSGPGMSGYEVSLLRDSGLGGHANRSIRAQTLHQAQRTHGNRAVQRQVAGGAFNGRVTVQRDPMEWMWERSSNVDVGDINNAVDVGSTAVEGITATNWAKRVFDASELAQVSKGAKGLGKGSDILGVGMGMYDFFNADDNYERVQAGADTIASGVGLFGGPLGGIFSAGYGAGQLINKATGLSSKIASGLDYLDGPSWWEIERMALEGDPASEALVELMDRLGED